MPNQPTNPLATFVLYIGAGIPTKRPVETLYEFRDLSGLARQMQRAAEGNAEHEWLWN